jgi:hypothetical protein
MRKFGSRLAVFLVLATTAGMLLASTAVADISIKEIPDFVEDITIGGGTELYFMALQQNAMGIDKNDYNWVDGHFKLNAAVKLKSNVEFKLGMIYAGTFGEDYFETYGIDNTDTSVFNADEAYIKFNKVAATPIDLTLGRQKINVEKGFLMSEGNLDLSTAIYANSEKASPFAIRADVNLEPVTLLAYWETIATDDVNVAFGKGDDIEAMGLNVHAALAEGKNLYAGVVRWLGTLSVAHTKQELMTYYLGTDLTFGAINFSGEYAVQTGDNYDAGNAKTDQDAKAYNAFLKYSLDGVALKPWFEVGTIYYSGDDTGTSANEGFNTMTPGFPDWGKWCPGEIFGEQIYFGANNWVDYTAQIGIMPSEATQIRMQYHIVSLAEDNGGDDALYHEYNLFFEYFPDDKLYCGIMLGMATPDDAQKAVFGDDETAIGIMPYIVYNF